MTILILDHPAGPMPPYHEWLQDLGEDLAVCTGRSEREVLGQSARGYQTIQCFPRYTSTTEVERYVVRLARCSAPKAIVATAHTDLIRAGALRDLLGIPGQGANDAVVLTDLVELRGRLHRGGVPVVPFSRASKPVDFYSYVSTWGFPLRVRRRRSAGWPQVGVLRDEAELSAFIPGIFEPGFTSVPSLMLEPGWPGAVVRERIRPASQASESAAHQALRAVPASASPSWTVTMRPDPDGQWLVDAVGEDNHEAEALRRAVRAQARNLERADSA